MPTEHPIPTNPPPLDTLRKDPQEAPSARDPGETVVSPGAREGLERMLASLVKVAGARRAVLRVVNAQFGELEAIAEVGLAAGTASAGGHVVGVPMRYEGRAIGTIDLHVAAPDAIPPAARAVVEAAGELVGAALEVSRRAREQLASGLVNERRMMANEVHDSLAQGLTYMRMRMSLLRDAIRQGDEARAHKYWDDVDSSLTNAHRRLRELITYFRTRMDSRGLVHALDEMSASFLDRTGVELRFANEAPDLELPVGREVQVFHIVQEALANVVKHANARRARLGVHRKGDGYEIVVEDDGVGMLADPAAGEQGETGHYGIAIMRERARRLGGELTLESAPGAGTRVRLYFPAVQPQSEEGP